MKTERLKTDILIIGGGTAGCYAALTISENSDAKVLICEKANIKRSGCLAAGVNALNAFCGGNAVLLCAFRYSLHGGLSYYLGQLLQDRKQQGIIRIFARCFARACKKAYRDRDQKYGQCRLYHKESGGEDHGKDLISAKAGSNVIDSQSKL